MNRCLKSNFALLLLAACSISLPAQISEKPIRSKAPELKLKIVSSKGTYVLHERMFTQTEFTNLTDKTLCFPEPVQGWEAEPSGYVITEGQPPANTTNSERFLDHFSGGPVWPREKLLEEIEQSWIKLGPNAVYVTKSAEARANLSVPGQWRLAATYHPPECSFNVAQCNEYFRFTAQSVGCTVPERYVWAEPTTVSVVPPPEHK